MLLINANFRKAIGRTEWRSFVAATVNAFYFGPFNSINICAAILSGVVFNVNRPRYMNYGALGMVTGHEITHGFDDQGSQRDGDGNVVDWWQPETKEKYRAKIQCMIDQYGNYTVDIKGKKIHLDGILTQGENIADNGGVKDRFLLSFLLNKN